MPARPVNQRVVPIAFPILDLHVRRHRLVLVLITVAILTLISPDTGGAQDIRTTTAGDCPLPPVEIPLFGGTPAAIIAATPSVGAIANSPAVDESLIRDAVSGIVACVNTGDPSFQYAIFTPRYLAMQFMDGAGHYQPAFESLLDTPAQPATVQFELLSVDDIALHADGRVMATLVLRTEEEDYRDTVLLAETDGHWLIDEIVMLEPAP